MVLVRRTPATLYRARADPEGYREPLLAGALELRSEQPIRGLQVALSGLQDAEDEM